MVGVILLVFLFRPEILLKMQSTLKPFQSNNVAKYLECFFGFWYSYWRNYGVFYTAHVIFSTL